ncbi:MAG: M20/M25/M40 family metallo-hydrolase [Aquificae bacterium]|nr:M20/M25/M40 family metallo-hydrolase [Aquificota bacterium]
MTVVELLKKLISIPSPSGKEQKVQLFIERFLKNLGFNPVRQPVEDGRFNLLLEGSSDFLVSVHVDTVPPAGFRDAYKPKERDGRIYGRGASDVKGGVAALLSALKRFRGAKPPFWAAFVVDEERDTALGSEKLLELITRVKRVLVLEPTYGKLCTSQMGTLEFTVTFECPSYHASEFERGKNPAYLLYEFVKRAERELNRPVNLLMLKSGSKLYRVPPKAEALLEVKLFPDEEPEKVARRLKSLLAGCRAELRVEDAEAYAVFRTDGTLPLLERVQIKVEGKVVKGVMPSWTDGANYHKAGKECVVFGYGSLADSHTDRESISLDELRRYETFLTELGKELLKEPSAL